MKNLRKLIPVDYVKEQLSKEYAAVLTVIAKIPDIIAARRGLARRSRAKHC